MDKFKKQIKTSIFIAVIMSSFFLYLLFSCGGDPAGVTSPISVTTPVSSTVWEHYQDSATIEWNGGSTDNVSIKLLEAGEAVTTLASTAPNSGTYILSDRVSPSWGTGTDFTIRIEDGLGEIGNSSQFEITVSSGEEIIQVTNPTSSTQWQHYEEDVTISWSYPSAKATESASRVEEVSTTRSTGTLSGDSVDIELYQGDTFVATLGSGVSSIAGSYIYAGPVLSTWGTGSNFKVRLVDNLGNYGFSSEFSITESSGQNVITVTQPNSSTEWEYEQSNTTVVWEYPDKKCQDRTRSSASITTVDGRTADNVRIEIWHDGSKVDDYSGWVPNTGSYTRTDPISATWGTGFNYQIKIIDENDNHGISENFLISGTIDVTTPSSSTVWDIGETNTQVIWSGGGAQVKLEIWYDGVKVDDYSGWIDNNGSYTRTVAVPSSWSIGEHFRIRVVESGSTPNDGFSDEFQIYDEIDITEPNIGTTWAWGEEGTAVEWNEAYSDSVRIDVYKSGSYLASFCSWIDNTGSYTRATAIPSLWGTGKDFKVKVIGQLGSTGYSEEFDLWAMDITEPDSSTVWKWDQQNTEVLWNPSGGPLVRMEIWKEGSKIDDYCGWTDNDGLFVRTSPIPESWGADETYCLRMIDDDDNVAWSKIFSIHGNYPDSISQTIEFGISYTNWHGICTIPSGNYVYVAGFDHEENLVAIRTDNNTIAEVIDAGYWCYDVSSSANGQYVYVPQRDYGTWDDCFAVISTSSQSLVTTVDVDDDPRGVCELPNGEYIYVTNYDDNNVFVIHTSDYSKAAEIAVGNQPEAICTIPSSEFVYVVNQQSSSVSVIECISNTVVNTIPVGGSLEGICYLPPYGEYLYIASSNQVKVIQTSTCEVIDTIDVGNGAHGICALPSGKYVYVANPYDSTVSIIRTSDNVVEATIEIGGYGPWDLCVLPSGNRAYVLGAYGSATVSVLE